MYMHWKYFIALVLIFSILPTKGFYGGLSNVYTRVTDADIEFIPPEEKLQIDVWVDIDVWNQMSTEIILNPCDLQVSVNFTNLPVNDTACKNDFPITLKPGINEMINGIANLDFVFPADAFPGIEKTDVTINLSTSVETGYLLNATVYNLAVNLSENQSSSDTYQSTLDPLPDNWGAILDDPDLPPLHFRISRAYATDYYLDYKTRLNANVSAELINNDAETAKVVTPNLILGYMDVQVNGNFTTQPTVLNPITVLTVVTTHEIKPGIQEFSDDFQAYILNYVPELEKNADLMFRYVIDGRDPNNPHFIPLLVQIRNGTITKTTFPIPELETSGTSSSSMPAIFPLIPYALMQYWKKRKNKAISI